jgi:hypothetical protein
MRTFRKLIRNTGKTVRALHVPFIRPMIFFVAFGKTQEKTMLSTKLAGCSLAAVAGVAMLALSMGPAAAFTLTSPSLEHSYSSAPVEKVWWDRWHRWHGPGYWGPRRCWRGYYGRLHCN